MVIFLVESYKDKLMNDEQAPCRALSPIEISFDFIQHDSNQDEQASLVYHLHKYEY